MYLLVPKIKLWLIVNKITPKPKIIKNAFIFFFARISVIIIIESITKSVLHIVERLPEDIAYPIRFPKPIHGNTS